jgi:hypothetical protein
MQFSKLTAVMACLLAPALAVDASVLNLVALCKDANFNGACYGSQAPDNTCGRSPPQNLLKLSLYRISTNRGYS